MALPPSPFPPSPHNNRHMLLSTLQAVGRTLCTPVHAQCCQQQPQHPVTIAAPDASRRQLLGSFALLGAAAATASLSAAQPAQAAATCELTSSPSGLQFCDTQDGTGPEPVKVCVLSCGGGGMWSVCVYSTQHKQEVSDKINTQQALMSLLHPPPPPPALTCLPDALWHTTPPPAAAGLPHPLPLHRPPGQQRACL